MRNVFIDLGSFYGSVINKFIASPLYSPGFEIHAFEVNPLLEARHFAGYPRGVTLHREAAWTHDGEIELYLNKDRRPNVQGTSVFKEKRTGDLDPLHPARVPCLDFSRWLCANFDLDDNILVKSNIEGAEYPLFTQLMNDGAIAFIKRLFLRTHWNKIDMPREVHDRFMEDIRRHVPHVDTEYNFV
jgi:hypothetical protein